jgi:hypothetical protein
MEEERRSRTRIGDAFLPGFHTNRTETSWPRNASATAGSQYG